MTNFPSPLAVVQGDNLVNEIIIVACAPENQSFISERLAPTKVSFVPLARLKERSTYLVSDPNKLVFVHHRYLDDDAKEWFKDSATKAIAYNIKKLNDVVYLELEEHPAHIKFTACAPTLQRLKEVTTEFRAAFHGAPIFKINSTFKTLFILNEKLASVSTQVKQYRESNPSHTTILLNNNARNKNFNDLYDYALTVGPRTFVIDSCSKVFVESFDDLFYNPLHFERFSLIGDLEQYELSEIPEFTYDEFLEKLITKILPLGATGAEAYLRLLPFNRPRDTPKKSDIDFSSPSSSRSIDSEVLKYCSRPLARLINSYPQGNAVYINTSHHGISNKDGYFTLKSKLGLKFAFYIHDLIPIDFPEYVRSVGYDDHVKRMDAVSFCADLVIVNSEATKTSFLSWCEANERPSPQCEVAYIGVEESFFEDNPDQFTPELEGVDQQDYFTYIGTIEPRKNHLFLLQIWRDWVLRGITPPKLVIVGKRGWENQNVFNFIDQCQVIKPYLVELSDLSDAGLKRVIRGAKAMLFPSFSEGWGMPLIETQAMGTPVICSDIPVFHEASAEKATFLNPLDAIGWQKTILDFCDPEKHAEATGALSDYEPPRWDTHFEVVNELLESMKSRHE